MGRRGHKNFGRNLVRGFKTVFGAAKRGAKQAPAALRTADKYMNTAANAMDTVGTYAHLAAADTGNTKYAEFGNNMLRRSDNLRNNQTNSAVLNQLRHDLSRR